MKNFLLILLCVPLIGFGQWPVSKLSSVESDGYGGRVKSVTKVECDYVDKFGNYVKVDCDTIDLFLYNSDGNIVSSYYNDIDLYVHGGRAEMAFEQVRVQHLKKYSGPTIFKYNSDGRKIEMGKYNSDGATLWKYTYKYDSDGNKIEESYYTLGGALKEKDIYKYDSDDNKIEESYYTLGVALKEKDIYKYDSDGNKI